MTLLQFLVKYVVDGTIKTTQGDRNHQSFAAIKAAIQKGSGKSNFKCVLSFHKRLHHS